MSININLVLLGYFFFILNEKKKLPDIKVSTCRKKMSERARIGSIKSKRSKDNLEEILTGDP